jgi:hypothetical protein
MAGIVEITLPELTDFLVPPLIRDISAALSLDSKITVYS